MKKSLLLITLFSIIFICNFAYAGEKIYHQRALELRGGMSLYMMMDDPNDWALQFQPGGLDEEMNYAPNFGFSLLYKSHQNFVWDIGYNHMLSSRTSWDNDSFEEVMQANEIYILPNFIIFPQSRLNFSLGAGPCMLFAKLDRNSGVGGNYGEFYGAYGRNLGIMAMVNAELVVLNNLALKANVGFRNVIVNDITVDGESSTYQVMWTTTTGTPTTRAYELDYTGVVAGVGLRWYFEPKKIW
jgi:hypothetical protein